MTYILGKEIVIETDHKPLVSLLGGKNLDSLPPRILRYRLRLARFQYSIVHVPGKSLCTADALSRSPVSTLENTSIQEEAETIMEDSISQLPASKSTLERFSNAQNSDPVCKRVIHYCLHGWPNKKTNRNIHYTILEDARGTHYEQKPSTIPETDCGTQFASEGNTAKKFMQDTKALIDVVFVLRHRYGGLASPTKSKTW